MHELTKKNLLVTQQPLWNIMFNEQQFLLDASGYPIAQLTRFQDFNPSRSFCFPGIGMVGIRFAAGNYGPKAYCYGILQKPGIVVTDGIREGFYARLYPGEFSRTFGIPAAEISPYGVPLNEIMPVQSYIAKIAEARTLKEFQTLFCRMAQEMHVNKHRHEIHQQVVEYMVREILCKNCECSLYSLIEQTGYSHRQINNLFHQYVGTAIKQLNDQIRFQRALQACLTSKKSLSTIASEFGYYDQSHFNREFRMFSTMSPRELQILTADKNLI